MCEFLKIVDHATRLTVCSTWHTEPTEFRECEGGGDVSGVLTPLLAEWHRLSMTIGVVELRVQLGVEEVEGKDREEQVGSRKGEASQRGVRHG